MKPRATVLILALSWAAQIIATDDSLEKRNEDEGWGRFTAKAEAREDAGPSLVNGDTEEEEIETTTKSLITGRFGVYRPVHQSTEIETYRDVCTGYIEGGGNAMQTTTCPVYSTCCFGGGFVTCTFSAARCVYIPNETAPPDSEKTEESKSSALSTGGIIGIAVSAACSVLGLIFTVAFKIWKHRRKEKESMQSNPGD